MTKHLKVSELVTVTWGKGYQLGKTKDTENCKTKGYRVWFIGEQGLWKASIYVYEYRRPYHAQGGAHPQKSPEKALSLHLWQMFKICPSRKSKWSQNCEPHSWVLKVCSNTDTNLSCKVSGKVLLLDRGIQGNIHKIWKLS